jgi:hypothetical protein
MENGRFVMGTPTSKGGYVIKLRTDKNITREMRIDDTVLQGIVEALGITKRAPGVNKSVSDIQSIFVFRGDE